MLVANLATVPTVGRYFCLGDVGNFYQHRQKVRSEGIAEAKLEEDGHGRSLEGRMLSVSRTSQIVRNESRSRNIN